MPFKFYKTYKVQELCLSRQQLCIREWAFPSLYLTIPPLSSSPSLPSTSLLLSGAAAQTLAMFNSQHHGDVQWLFILWFDPFTQYRSYRTQNRSNKHGRPVSESHWRDSFTGCYNIHVPLLSSLSSPLVCHTRQKWRPRMTFKLFSFLMACLVENISGNPLYDGPPYRMLVQIGMCL